MRDCADGNASYGDAARGHRPVRRLLRMRSEDDAPETFKLPPRHDLAAVRRPLLQGGDDCGSY
eukprot:1115997-Prorocentrum_minimum.AAC.2